MTIRHEAMRFELERRRLEVNGPLIEGRVVGESKMLSDMDYIGIVALPTNLRAGSPHLPDDFDTDRWRDEHPGEPWPFTPVEQSEAALTMPLPGEVVVDYHPGTDPELVVEMVADGVDLPPDRATALWGRVRAYNDGLAKLREALDSAECRLAVATAG
jgi:hypothetical protein